MTIFLDCTYTRTQQGSVGITRVVRNLSRQLVAQLPPGELVLVVAGREGFKVVDSAAAAQEDAAAAAKRDPEVAAAIRLFRLVTSSRLRATIVRSLPLALQVPLWRLYSRLTFEQISRGLPSADIRPGDLVILCDASWTYDVWSCARKAAVRGARIVTLVYDLIPLHFPQYCAPLFTAVFRGWLREAVASSHGIICISQTTQRDVEQYCRGMSRSAPALDHFRLGSDLDLKDAQGPVRDDVHRLCAQAAKLFLMVGSIDARKNQAFALEAFERVWASDADVMLVVVGRASGDVGAILKRLVGHSKAGSRVFVFQDANDAELDCLYRHARALIFPSAAEGFGLPLVEARQRGCLVLASDIAAFRELADAGVRLFSLADPGNLARCVLDVLIGTAQPPPPMPVFTWKASAEQFLSKVRALAESAP
jgi:alpha-1,2-rhamnosyltransferase